MSLISESISHLAPSFLTFDYNIYLARDYCFDIDCNSQSRLNFIKKSIYHSNILSRNYSPVQKLSCSSLVDDVSEYSSYKALPGLKNFKSYSKNLRDIEFNLRLSNKHACYLKSLMSSISSSKKLQSLNFEVVFQEKSNHNEIVKHLTKVMKKQANLKSLSFYIDPSMNKVEIVSFSKALESLKMLSKLKVQMSLFESIQGQGTLAFTRALGQLRSLKDLDLSYKQKSGNILLLSLAIKELKDLERLNLKESCDLKEDESQILFSSLSSLTKLKELNLQSQNQGISAKANEAFALALKNMNELKKLELDFEHSHLITGFDCVFCALVSLKNLAFLKLNFISIELVKSLKSFANLEELGLVINEYKDFRTFCGSIGDMVNLKSLHLRGYQDFEDEIDIEALKTFCNATKNFNLMTDLLLEFNSFHLKDSVGEIIFSLLDSLQSLENANLTFYSISNDKIQEKFLTKLLKFSESKHRLKKLSLRFYNLVSKDEDFELFPTCIANFASLQEFSITFYSCYAISLKLMENIITSLASLKKLERIDLIYLNGQQKSEKSLSKIFDDKFKDNKILKSVYLYSEEYGNEYDSNNSKIKKKYNRLKSKKMFESHGF